jgi:superfamily II DNA or RNA helicase
MVDFSKNIILISNEIYSVIQKIENGEDEEKIKNDFDYSKTQFDFIKKINQLRGIKFFEKCFAKIDFDIMNNKTCDDLKSELEKFYPEGKKLFDYIIDFIFKNNKYPNDWDIIDNNEEENKNLLNDEVIIDKNDDANLDEIDKQELIELRPHQKKGIENAKNNNFNSGIHSSATGSGKSIMALCIMNEYHKLNNKDTLMWLCERKDIPQKLFFNKVKDNKDEIKEYFYKEKDGKNTYKYVKNEKLFKKFKDSNIINMDNFEIMEFVYNKPSNWVEKINNYKGNKPLFLIMNRAFMTTNSKVKEKKYRYQELTTNVPKFIIMDECHSSMAPMTYKLLLHCKYNFKAKIQGLSATPYRKGKSYGKINIPLEGATPEQVEKKDNMDKLISIYHKEGNINELNILSWFNLKEAIEEGVVLEPVFHWFDIDSYSGRTKEDRKNTKYNEKEIEAVMKLLNNIVSKCAYRKCIIWCRLKELANEWYLNYSKEKNKYNNLKYIEPYLDHSCVSSKNKNDYDIYYAKENDAILFCAGMHREGSDIPNLGMCMFLDKVASRGEVPFIQCVGRVLRLDPEGNKEKGHVIDCVIGNESDDDKTKQIVDMILGYYLRLYEIAKSDLKFQGDKELEEKDKDKLNDKKMALYNEMMKSLVVDEKNKKMYIKLNYDKKVTINLKKLGYSVIEWNKIVPKFERLLKNEMIVNDFEDFWVFKQKCIEYGIKNKYEYFQNREKYQLYFTDPSGNVLYVDPKSKWQTFFGNWYKFLDRDTSQFIKDKDEWINYCKGNDITHLNYDEKVKEEKHNCLPDMPEEIYSGLKDLSIELGKGIYKERRK